MSTNKPIEWFRQATPYINAHRGKTFVLMLSGDALADDHIHDLVHDIVLLHSLGIKLVITHGIRRQLDERLSQQNHQSTFSDGLRVTTEQVLNAAIETSSLVRSRLERKLSMGLPNSPMHGASIKVSSANVVSARPAGVINGVDLMHTGTVRKVDGEAIENLLSLGHIVLLSPIGYSSTGEAFNLLFQDLAAAIATEIQADKVIAFTHSDDQQTEAIDHSDALTAQEAQALVTNQPDNSEFSICLQRCIDCINKGIPRSHLLDYRVDGALLMELFSVDGQGLLIQDKQFEHVREARPDDIPAIIDIIRPLEKSGVLVRRDREKLEAEIDRFCVIEREELTVAVAALYMSDDSKFAEVACITTHPDYQGHQRGGTLLQHLESKAKSEGAQRIFVLTTQTTHWFIEQGFELGSIDDLPDSKQDLYNYQRNSKVLIKDL